MAAYDALRLLVLAAAAGTALLALGSWAVTTRRLNPFGRPARLVIGQKSDKFFRKLLQFDVW